MQNKIKEKIEKGGTILKRKMIGALLIFMVMLGIGIYWLQQDKIGGAQAASNSFNT